MNAVETINKRHSYRGKYFSKQVPKEDLIKILEAGMATPSGCNKQTTSLIAVDDMEKPTLLHPPEKRWLLYVVYSDPLSSASEVILRMA